MELKVLEILFKNSDLSNVRRLILELQERELTLSNQLSTKGLAAQGCEIRYHYLVNLTWRDLALLDIVKDALPPLLQLSVEDSFRRKWNKLEAQNLSRFYDYQDILLKSENQRWLIGRIQKRLETLLSRARVQIVRPRKANRRSRPRTPSSVGGPGITKGRSVRKAQEEYAYENKERLEYQETQLQESRNATHILFAEQLVEHCLANDSPAKEGESPAEKSLQDQTTEPHPVPVRCELEDLQLVKLLPEGDREVPLRCQFCPEATRQSCLLRNGPVVSFRSLMGL